MKLQRSEKDQLVAALSGALREHPNVYLTDFTGLAVKNITDLRRRLRDAGVTYVVIKNTLARRALAEAGIEGLEEHLTGPTAFALAHAPVEAAKILVEFQKEFEAFHVKAARVEGLPADARTIERLATLPTRDELLGQLAGGLQSPLQGFVGALNGLLYQWVGALEALRAQRAEAA